jgi:hypothetical protein
MLETSGGSRVPSIEITVPTEVHSVPDATSFHIALLDLNDDARVSVLRRKDEISRDIQLSGRLISPEVQKFREQSEKVEPPVPEPSSVNRSKLFYLEQLKEKESPFTRILTLRGVRRHDLRKEVFSAFELRKREEQRFINNVENDSFTLKRGFIDSGSSRDATAELAAQKIQHRVENQKAAIKEIIGSVPDELTGGTIEKKTNEFLTKHGEIRNVMYDQYQTFHTLKVEIEYYLAREQRQEKQPLDATQQWLTSMNTEELSQLYHAVSQEALTLKERYKSMTGKSIDAMTKIDKMNEIAKKELESMQKDIYDRATRQALRVDRDTIMQSLIDETTSPWARIKDIWTYGNSTAANVAAALDGKRVEEGQKKL